MENNQNELIKVLNRRLAESAKFWYQCIDEYQEINEFLSSLNALIQSLRNVTFIIQKHKDKIPYFDDWYPKKQDIMKHDPLMIWLVKARNQVVKQGDLKINSVAIATVKNWLEYVLCKLQVDPLSNTDEIIDIVLSELKSKEIVHDLREPLLQIEKTWRVEQFPDRDVLEVLAYCYKLLKSIVHDLYIQIGIKEPASVEYIERDKSLISGHVSRLERTINIDLKDGSVLQHRTESLNISKKDLSKATKRLTTVGIHVNNKTQDEHDPFSYMKTYLEISMVNLTKDGYHEPMVHYFFEDHPSEIHGIPSVDKTQQYYHIRQIAEDIIIKRVTGLIFILEQWTYLLEKPSERGECLMVACIRSDGKFEAHITPFIREKDSIRLMPTTIENNLGRQNWLRPIVQAWNVEI